MSTIVLVVIGYLVLVLVIALPLGWYIDYRWGSGPREPRKPL